MYHAGLVATHPCCVGLAVAVGAAFRAAGDRLAALGAARRRSDRYGRAGGGSFTNGVAAAPPVRLGQRRRKMAQLGSVRELLGDLFHDRGDRRGEEWHQVEQVAHEGARDPDRAIRLLDEVFAGEHRLLDQVKYQALGKGPTRFEQVERPVWPVSLRGVQADGDARVEAAASHRDHGLDQEQLAGEIHEAVGDVAGVLVVAADQRAAPLEAEPAGWHERGVFAGEQWLDAAAPRGEVARCRVCLKCTKLLDRRCRLDQAERLADRRDLDQAIGEPWRC